MLFVHSLLDSKHFGDWMLLVVLLLLLLLLMLPTTTPSLWAMVTIGKESMTMCPKFLFVVVEFVGYVIEQVSDSFLAALVAVVRTIASSN